jgi:hypothetical protein
LDTSQIAALVVVGCWLMVVIAAVVVLRRRARRHDPERAADVRGLRDDSG